MTQKAVKGSLRGYENKFEPGRDKKTMTQVTQVVNKFSLLAIKSTP